MLVCEVSVNAHVFKEAANMSLKEPLCFFVIICRADKDSAKMSFPNVGKSLLSRKIFSPDIVKGLGTSLLFAGLDLREIF